MFQTLLRSPSWWFQRLSLNDGLFCYYLWEITIYIYGKRQSLHYDARLWFHGSPLHFFPNLMVCGIAWNLRRHRKCKYSYFFFDPECERASDLSSAKWIFDLFAFISLHWRSRKPHSASEWGMFESWWWLAWSLRDRQCRSDELISTPTAERWIILL